MVNAVSFLEAFHDRGPTKGAICMLYGSYVYTYKCFMLFFGVYIIYTYTIICTCGAQTHTHICIYVLLLCICLCFCASSFVCHIFDARHDLCPRHSGEGTAARQDTNRSNWDGTSSGSMDWLKEGTSTGNHRISHEIWFFVVNCPLNQSNWGYRYMEHHFFLMAKMAKIIKLCLWNFHSYVNLLEVLVQNDDPPKRMVWYQ